MKINLGCGHNYKEGWVNVDFYDDSKCDVKHDLEVFPWPWEDNSVSEILIKHTLEHLGADWKVYIKTLQEMYRICEDDAKIMITVPSPWHWNYVADPTHVRPVTPDGLNLFSKEHCQKCIDEDMSETPFAMIYNIDLRPHDVKWVYDDYWQNKLDRGEVHQSQMEELHSKYRNVVTEFQILLAVVKSEETAKKHTYEHQLHLPDGSVPNKTPVPSNIVRS
jgi:predicted SAM-dependent methyltransferase